MCVPRLLIIDDDPQLRRVYARCLRRDFIVDCEVDVESGLDMIDEGRVFDAILCDLNLPEMTGRDLYNQLRARAHVLADRLVIITGDEPILDDDFTAMLLESERYLVKTCSLDQLKETMCRVAAPRVSSSSTPASS